MENDERPKRRTRRAHALACLGHSRGTPRQEEEEACARIDADSLRANILASRPPFYVAHVERLPH
eukprot:3987083-Pyramimonas_sp.AAC.1